MEAKAEMLDERMSERKQTTSRSSPNHMSFKGTSFPGGNPSADSDSDSECSAESTSNQPMRLVYKADQATVEERVKQMCKLVSLEEFAQPLTSLCGHNT